MKDFDTKSATQQFLTMITSGRIAAAYEEYVDMSGRHHNTFTPAGFAALRDGMLQNDHQFPDKQLTIRHIVADGDLVIAHSHLVMKPGDTGMIVVHIVRFAQGKIVELWDCGQMIGDEAVNSDGPF